MGFLYFAYGSNLLQSRIRQNNPSATRKCIAKLKGYRLEFIGYSRRWQGAKATIVEDPDEHVWGAVWELDLCDGKSLDDQEGVSVGIYRRLDVEVETENNEIIRCFAYQGCKSDRSPETEDDILPSITYLSTIVEGAIESHIPEDYCNKLRSFTTNKYNGLPIND